MNSHYSQGFSAAELLITLFIAAAFLATGYQLYSAITQDSAVTRQKAIASNVAYDYLQRHAANVPNICTPSTPLNNHTPAQSIDGITHVRITVTITCPQSSLSTLSRVQSTVRYGQGSEEVSHALFVTQ